MTGIVRYIVAVALAGAVTFGLFFFMQFLIAISATEPETEEGIKLADITMPERALELELKEVKPEKPDEPEEPPPELELPEVEVADVNPDGVAVNLPNMGGLALGSGFGLGASDGEYLPIVKVAPQYPRRALQRGIEGYVIVEFVVTKAGSVKDPVVVKAEPPGIFDRAAIKAASKFKYKPKVVNGEAIDVAGVQNIIRFQLEK